MVRTIIGTACGILALGTSAVVYCCLRAGALYDQYLLAPPPEESGKEETEHGTESDTG